MNYFITHSNTQNLFSFSPLSLFKCIEILSTEKMISIDVETTGLNYLDDNLLMLQVSTETDNFVIDCQTVDIFPMQNIFLDRNILKIGHNLSFDLKFLRSAGIRTENVYCTFLTEKVIHCGKPIRMALKSLLERYLNIEMSKEVRNSFINHKGDFNIQQVEYGIEDTVHLFKIRSRQGSLLIKGNLELVAKLESESLLAFVDMEFNGMHLDKSAWTDLARTAKTEVDELAIALDKYLANNHPEYKNNQMDLFGGGRDAIISWTSPKQVLGLFKKYASELESVGADVLLEYKNKIPLVNNYVKYKEQSKLANAYGLDFFKYILSDGNIHTNFNQIMNTGRVSSRSPNMQQVPAKAEYRNAFIPDEPDHVFVSCDFSAQELCIIAIGSKDPVWLNILRQGGDLHSKCAELVFKDEWFKTKPDSIERKKLRTHVKTINFALAYGAGPFSISKSLEITEREAKELIDTYYKAFPRIKNFLNALGKYGKEHGLVKTFPPFRRTRYFPEWDGRKTPRKEMSKVVRASKNTCIQGSAADQTKTALILVRKEIRDNKLPVKMVLAVHDEINTTCHKDFAVEWGKTLSRLMERAAEINMGEKLIKAEVTISNKWEK